MLVSTIGPSSAMNPITPGKDAGSGLCRRKATSGRDLRRSSPAGLIHRFATQIDLAARPTKGTEMRAEAIDYRYVEREQREVAEREPRESLMTPARRAGL